jgi:hypothetical protein
MVKVNQFHVKNQFVLEINGNRYFQSYNTVIAKIDTKGKTYLDKDSWNYSRTTGKYRNMFLGENIDQTRKNIKNGTYKLINLN